MTEWLTDILYSLGYAGIAVLVALARLVPPIPAEAVIPLSGTAARGLLDLFLIAIAGGVGSAIGELAWYAPSRLASRERYRDWLSRHGHWLTVRPQQVDRATRWFERFGGWAVLLAQPVPGLRNLVCIPAGAARQPLPIFLLASFAGSALTIMLLASAGFLAARGWPQLTDYLGIATLALFAALIGLYLFRLFLLLRHRPSQTAAAGPLEPA